MPGKKRDPQGYALGRDFGPMIAARVRRKMGELKRSEADIMRATGIPNSHISNLLTGKGDRLWQRHHVKDIGSALGMSEMELVGDLLFPEVGTVVTQHMPPGLAEFAKHHATEITLAELQRLRDEIRVVERDGERTYDERFWLGALRLLREATPGKPKKRGG